MPTEIEPNGGVTHDPSAFLLENSPAGLLPGVIFELRDIGKIWQLVGDGTAKYQSARFGFVSIGPELGNLGGSPQIRLTIDHHLTLKVDMRKEGGGSFYQAVPGSALQERTKKVSRNLVADGANTYLVTKEGRERICFKSADGEFVYDPGSRIVTNADELSKHLILAAQLYRAYVVTYYEENKLQPPSDVLIFDGQYLSEEENTRNTGNISRNETESLDGVVISDRPNVTFEDIGGQERAVAVCRRFANQLRYPEIFALEGSGPPRGILLSGPPGTGKTLLAKAIAHEADSHFLHVDASDIAGEGLYGQSEKAVKGVFDLAKKLSSSDGRHAVIFIDEGDLLLPRTSAENGHRHEATGKTISIFAQEMDGLNSSPRITVIISTNDPLNLDPRILSRMEESEEVPMPNQDGLRKILQIHFTKYNKRAYREIFGSGINLEMLSEKAYKQGLSGRDIADVVAIVSRQRGERQLLLIESAIKQGQLQIFKGDDERLLMGLIADRIRRNDVTGIEGLILSPATFEEISEVIDKAKTLLKNKPRRRLGFHTD